jgi:GNAT superfamily N-acetyltransferase
MRVQVRDATPADAAAVAELLGDLAYPTTATEVASRLRRFGADPASRVLLAAAEARQLDACRLDLSSGDWRADAHSFYERLGFVHRARSYTRWL